MSNIDKRSLRAKARSASAGEWIKESGDGLEAICSSDDQANGNFIIAHFEGPDAKANREFAQASHPDVVLALLDELEAKDKRIAEQVEIIAKQDKWIKDVEATMISATDQAEVAENRVTELEAMLARLYTECDTGERRGNGSQSGVAMPSWVTVEAARLLLGVK